eukprot:413354-Rhodomonas_salina.1
MRALLFSGLYDSESPPPTNKCTLHHAPSSTQLSRGLQAGATPPWRGPTAPVGPARGIRSD